MHPLLILRTLSFNPPSLSTAQDRLLFQTLHDFAARVLFTYNDSSFTPPFPLLCIHTLPLSALHAHLPPPPALHAHLPPLHSPLSLLPQLFIHTSLHPLALHSQDRLFFETLYDFAARVLFTCNDRKRWHGIENELGRIFRSKHFNLAQVGSLVGAAER